jgi:hypothetical protein
MPIQLRDAFKPKRSRHSIVELLPHINAADLNQRGVFTEIGPHCLPFNQFISSLSASPRGLHVTYRDGRNELIGVYWQRVGFGLRPYLVCPCGHKGNRLFLGRSGLRCRYCCGAVYYAQTQDRKGRQLLRAAKLRLLKLGGLPQPNLTLPPRRKGKHKARYARLCAQIQTLEHRARKHRKRFDPALFAYHVD